MANAVIPISKGKKTAKKAGKSAQTPNSGTDRSKTLALDAPVRFVTAASLFDGHDAAIIIMRRILPGAGAEVIHLGHNRSVD